MELSGKYWKAKEDEKDRILLLHGMGGRGALWRPVASSLEDSYSILAPDQRGHGDSQSLSRGDEDFSPQAFGYDLKETLLAREFHPTWVVGHSMGVRSACALAHTAPQLVKGLVLIDLGFFGPAGGGLGETLSAFLKILPPQFPSRNEARDFMEKHCPDPSIAQYLLAVSSPTPGGGVEFPFQSEHLVRISEATRDFSLREWIREAAQNQIPVLALRGEKSLVWSSDEFQKEKQLFSDLEKVTFEEFEGAGHGLPFERRKDFVERLKRFIKDFE